MATTADILGLNSRPKIPSRWAEIHRRLCMERDRLIDRDNHTPEATQTKVDDLAETGSEESERSISFVMANATQATIQEVLSAIRRIEVGTFGICEITGQPIEPDRLDAIPWTRYSLQGQKELEQQGLVRKTSLPSLQSLSDAETTADKETDKESEPE